MQEVNYPSTSIHHMHIHVQSWALGHIQIQGHRPIQNTFKYEINTRQPDEAGKTKWRLFSIMFAKGENLQKRV